MSLKLLVVFCTPLMHTIALLIKCSIQITKPYLDIRVGMKVIKYRPATLLFLKRVILFLEILGKCVILLFFFTTLFFYSFFLPIKVKSIQKSKAVTNNVCDTWCIVKVHTCIWVNISIWTPVKLAICLGFYVISKFDTFT